MSWRQILGHDRVQHCFTAAWQRGRLGQAYLFVGPRGIGKARFARELAKALLCEQSGTTLEACDQCRSCRQFDAATHPDLLWAARPNDKHEIPIETIRELCGQLSLRPVRGQRRIAIVEDADDLNDASANCFLKTLEEPPAGAILILIGSDLQRQLSTIVSRCQVIHFHALAPALLDTLLAGQGITEPEQRELLVRLAAGSVGLGLALHDPSIWTFREQMLDELNQTAPRFVTLAKRWQQFIEEAGKDSAAHRQRAMLVLRMLVDLLRQAKYALVLERTEDARFGQLGERLGLERILRWLDRTFEADMHLERRVQVVVVIEALLDALGRDHPAMPALPAASR